MVMSVEDRPKNPARKRRITILVTCAVAVYSLVLFAVTYKVTGAIVRFNTRLEQEKHPPLDMISRWTDIKFPKSSVLLGSKAVAWAGDCSMNAKIEMNRSDVDTFIRSLPKPRTNQQLDYSSLSDDPIGPDFWDPSTAKKRKEINMHQDEDRVCQLLIKLDDQQKAVVYLKFLQD